MKIIDLLVKIANGEEVPKKIKYKGIIREYDNTDKDYITREIGEEFYLFYNVLKSGTGDEFKTELNDEVEIIEEDKEIEEVHFITEHDSFSIIDQYELQETINKLIRAVNKLKEKVEE